MIDEKTRYNQVQNIIRRSKALILNVKLLGADTSQARDLLDYAKGALDEGDFNTAIEYAKKSMVEVMALKKQVEANVRTGAQTQTDQTVTQSIPVQIQTEDAEAENSPTSEPSGTSEFLSGIDGGGQSEISDIQPSGELGFRKESRHAHTPIPKSDISHSTEKPSKRSLTNEDLKQFEEGFSYLIEESRANICFQILSKFVKNGLAGLCICRTNPAIIKRKYDLEVNSTVLWLTDRDTSKEATISASLESMIYVAEEFIENNENGVILLDGLEYLISNNSFNPVLRFLRRLIDRISETSSLLLIAVSPKAINEQELKLLERELHPVFFN